MNHAVYLDPESFIANHHDLIASSPLLADAPTEQLRAMLLKCRYQRLPKGELLISPKHVNNHLHVLLSGELIAHIHAGSLENGFSIPSGEFVGEVSFIDNQAPTSYVTAANDSLLLSIPDTIFWTEFLTIPGLSKNLLRLINTRTRARNQALQKTLEQAMRLKLLENELRIAQELQANILPESPLFPHLSGLEVDAVMKPAKEVGGDLYDAFALDQEHICLAIGDVAGKGVPAALFMMRAITILRHEMLTKLDLLHAIRKMNEVLCDKNPQCMFLTLMVFVFNTHSGELQYANGGHNPPILGSFGQGFDLLKQPKGMLLGINPRADFQLAAINLKPGDMLIAYTDGITEANNPQLEEYSEERFINLLNSQSDQPISQLLNHVIDDVQNFAAGAEQSDDLTLLILRYTGGQPA